MATMDLADVAAYDVATRNDPRFDGQFYSAVLTTGIFCRPGCPGRPRSANVRFFATAAAAAAAGFRPCLRCHPESAPDPPDRHATSPVVSRALRLIGEGVLDEEGVAELACRLNVSPRHLQRLFVDELGAPPVAVAQTRRLLFAKKLIDETDLPMADIAFSAGYSSVRRFNEAIRQTYARTPTELRAKRRHAVVDPDGATIELRLFYRDPYNWPAVLAFLAEWATPGVEHVDPHAYRRTVDLGGKPGILGVQPLAGRRAVLLRVPVQLSPYLLPITERVKQLFDLKADPATIEEWLEADPSLAPIVRSQRGMRLPGCWDGFELAVRALLEAGLPGRGREAAATLVDACGVARPDAGDPALTHLYPAPARLRVARLEDAGIGEPLAGTLRALARAVDDGKLSLDGAAGLPELTAGLAAIPGVDAAVIPYLALRVLGEPDLDLDGSPLLRGHDRAARPAEPAAGDGGRWRGYAAMYRWAAARCGWRVAVPSPELQDIER